MSTALARRTNPLDDAPQFGVRALFVSVLVVAVVLASAQMIGEFAIAPAFLAAAAFSVWAMANGVDAQRLLALDLIWGVAMPLACLVLDSGVVQPTFDSRDSSAAPVPPPFTPLSNRTVVFDAMNVAYYAAIGFQMLILSIWLFYWPRLVRTDRASFRGSEPSTIGEVLTGMAAGGLFIGAVWAGLTALVMIATLVAFLLLGIPLLTTWVYWRRTRQAWSLAERLLNPNTLAVAVVLGAAWAVCVPFFIWLALGDWRGVTFNADP